MARYGCKYIRDHDAAPRPKEFVDLASSVSVSIKPIQQIIEEISALLPELHFIEKDEGRSCIDFL